MWGVVVIALLKPIPYNDWVEVIQPAGKRLSQCKDGFCNWLKLVRGEGAAATHSATTSLHSLHQFTQLTK